MSYKMRGSYNIRLKKKVGLLLLGAGSGMPFCRCPGFVARQVVFPDY